MPGPAIVKLRSIYKNKTVSCGSAPQIQTQAAPMAPEAKIDVPGNKTGNNVRNGSLAGKTHPVTGVPFDNNGYPIFESKYDIKLDSSLYSATDRVQFKEASKQLNQAIQNSPDLRNQFTEEQLADIAKGRVPEGYTWHHHQDEGAMQLVESDIHSKTGHTGGRSIWGGGSENR